MPSSSNRPPGLSSSKAVVVRVETLPPTTATNIDMVIRRLALDVKTDSSEPCVDPCALAHTPGVAHYGPPAFDLTLRSIDLARRIGVEATPKQSAHWRQ